MYVCELLCVGCVARMSSTCVGRAQECECMGSPRALERYWGPWINSRINPNTPVSCVLLYLVSV